MIKTHCYFFCPVLSGGILCEAFIITSGSARLRTNFKKLEKNCRENNRQAIVAESTRITNDVRVPFYFHVLACLSNRGRAAKRQLFFQTLLIKSRGLSRTGTELMHFMNACLPPRTYDEEQKLYDIRIENTLRSCSLILMF